MNAQEEWKGYSLDELRQQRAISLVKLELEKNKLATAAGSVKDRAHEQGLRGLVFSNSLVKGLNVVDYALLAFKLSQLGFKFWKKRKLKH